MRWRFRRRNIGRRRLIGRTWLQQALPITLGLKFAQWLDALTRHRERLAQCRSRVLALQFGGAAGTLASLRDKAPVVAQALADDLGLQLPCIAVAYPARPHRGSGGVLRHADRHAGKNRARYLAAHADGSRRTGRAGGGRQGRFVDDAAQTQPRRLRSSSNRRDARAESRRDRVQRHGAGARTRARRLAGRMGSAARSGPPDAAARSRRSRRLFRT